MAGNRFWRPSRGMVPVTYEVRNFVVRLNKLKEHVAQITECAEDKGLVHELNKVVQTLELELHSLEYFSHGQVLANYYLAPPPSKDPGPWVPTAMREAEEA